MEEEEDLQNLYRQKYNNRLARIYRTTIGNQIVVGNDISLKK